ncbi:hypothetical protein MCC93_17340 [Morococcus cerebrosus]|uniref:Uncharacterized protein n=1 Tax=Morococcus cerebrosus TaxID=1056807 RepID=A0A0C1GK65_9NEIS|nr:hypothetical protein MCC93_17340 [Morococcus cerebrosus]
MPRGRLKSFQPFRRPRTACILSQKVADKNRSVHRLFQVLKYAFPSQFKPHSEFITK